MNKDTDVGWWIGEPGDCVRLTDLMPSAIVVGEIADAFGMLTDEIARLQGIQTAAHNLFSSMDTAIPGWREETFAVEGGDIVNQAWRELAEALGENTMEASK